MVGDPVVQDKVHTATPKDKKIVSKNAGKAMDSVRDDAGDRPDVAALLRAALRSLSRA